MQNFSLHTHTYGFDGQQMPQAMIEVAARRGMRTLGISNHFIVHPDIKISPMYPHAVRGGYDAIYSDSFDVAQAKFKPLFRELARLDGWHGMRVLRGAEVDFFPSPTWRRGFDQTIRDLHPDYVIGAVHFVEYGGRLCNVHDIAHASPRDADEMLRLYWDKVRAAAASGLFHIMAHLDLPKKVGLGRDDHWLEPAGAALDAMAATGCVMELNTSIFGKMGEPYPSGPIVEMAAARDIPLILSDDAHGVDHIGRNFDGVEQWARQHGAKNFVGYQKILDFSRQRD